MNRHWQFGSVATVNRFDFVSGTPSSGTISFAARESTRTITVQMQGHTDAEDAEPFLLELPNPGVAARLGPSTFRAFPFLIESAGIPTRLGM